MCREQQNSTERIRLIALDSSNAGVTGATVLLSIRRDADGFYWSGAAFGAGFNTVAMTETDATNRAGEYHYDFNTSGLADAVYSFRATSVTAAIINDPWEGEIKIGGFVDNIDAAISSRSDFDEAANQVIVATNNDKTGYRLSATGVDDVWDEAQSGHTSAGTFGKYVDIEISSRLATSGYTTPATAGAVADAVWDESTVGHTTSGTFGEQAKTDIDAILADTDSLDTTKITTTRAENLDDLDVAVSTRSSHSATDVWASASRTLTASLDPTAAQIADAICDEIVSGHLTPGSVGDYLNKVKKMVFNKLDVTSGVYTSYEDNGTDAFSTGTTNSADGNRTPT